jgi:hypothetical protein
MTEEAAMADGPAIRFEAKVLPGERQVSLQRVADLDLDRIPDPEGDVRVLISTEDAENLVERGYEVVLLRAQRVQPLDPRLVSDDDSVSAWLEQQTRGIERQEGS